MHKSALIICLLLFTACGSNQHLACSGQDWKDLGFETAVTGKSVRTFDSYKDQCGSRLEANAMDLYLDGYTMGILGYCTYEKGYELGSSNRSVKPTCPLELRAEFNRGYNQGKVEFDKKADLMKKMDAAREESDRVERATQNMGANRSPGD